MREPCSFLSTPTTCRGSGLRAQRGQVGDQGGALGSGQEAAETALRGAGEYSVPLVLLSHGARGWQGKGGWTSCPRQSGKKASATGWR